MAPRQTSWRDLPSTRRVRGAQYTPGGLGAWRSVARELRPETSTRRGGDGRGQANDLERQIAAKALDKGDKGFNLFNAGGRALLGALDALDTPGAFVRSGLKEAYDWSEGRDASFDDFTEQGWRNIPGSEVLYGERGEEEQPVAFEMPVLGKIGTGFLFDVATDPLTLLTGGGAKVGTEAGEAAARKLLSEQGKKFLGEAVAEQAERGGRKFLDAAERTAFVTEQGTVAANRAAQTAVKYGSNQALDPLAREAIGSTPGTFVRIPGGKRLPVDKLVERVAPSRVEPSRSGGAAFKLTKRELGAGKAAGKIRTRITQGPAGSQGEHGFGNRIAELFVKRPEVRRKMLFGTPEESATAFLSTGARTAGDLQERLFESTWMTKLSDLKARAQKAGVDGEDLYFATAERLNGPSAMGEASLRVLAQAEKRGDTGLVQEIQQFWDDILEPFNTLDPELPVLMHRQGYVPRRPSESAIRRRGGLGTGGQLRKETFDFRRQYGAKTPENPDAIDDLLGERIVDPATHEKHWTEERQIKEIVEGKGLPNYFSTNAFEAFPDQVRAMARRFGDEFMAKQLRDLGIAEPSYMRRLTEAGVKQGKINAAVYKMVMNAQIRADRRALKAREAQRTADAGLSAAQRGRGFVKQAKQGVDEIEAERRELQGMADVLNPAAVREYEAQIRDDALTHAVQREALMANVAEAEDVVFGLEHAVVEQGHRLAMETYRSTERVTRLEAASAASQQELGELLERMRAFEGNPITASAQKLMQQTEAKIAETMGRMREIDDLLHQFEDLAAMPTDRLDNQLTRVDQQLTELLAQYDELPDGNLANKINALGNTKASILHEKGVIERARGRVAEMDREAPDLVATLDTLTDTNAMGDRIVHAAFPELPPEVSGARVRDYFTDRMADVQRKIDDTNGQALSAYADRDTMRAELTQIRTQKRAAEANLQKVSQEITAKQRDLWTQEQELLDQADVAMNRAIEIDDELEMAKEQLGEFSDQLKSAEFAEQMAEHYLSVMEARQLRYESQALVAEATASEARKTEQAWAKIAKEQFNKDIETSMQSALRDGFKQIGAVSQTQHTWLVEAMQAATVMAGPQGLRPALRMFDKVQNVWKAAALSTPGTVLRNMFGGIFNNSLSAQNVVLSDYTAVTSFLRGGRRGLTADDVDMLEQIQGAGLMGGSAMTLEIERSIGRASKNPLTTDFAGYRFFRRQQEGVERLVRGALAYRTLRNGGTMDDAIAEVMKFHFDYGDISAFERSALRRAVPFYTWTRKNFPLMLEQIVKNPTNFSRFYQLKQEIEYNSPEETLIPSYFTENMAVRMPFALQSAQAYILPDLPFMALNDVTDPSMAFSQMSPFVKMPVEYAFGKQFFKGIPLRDEYQVVPKPMQAIPGLMEGLGAVGLAERGAEGWMMKQKNLYVGEQMLPVFGRTRRLFPSEDKFDTRVMSTWISFLGGVGMRTNTEQERRNAAYARVNAELDRYETEKELGTFAEGTKMPRFGQTVSAAYEQLGVEKEQ